MVTETFANLPSTTVSSGGTDAPAGGTQETWTVAASTSFPAAATGVTQFHISDPAQPSEIVAVTNVSGTTWTVTRGAESTTPVMHTAGFGVKQVVTAGFLGGLVLSPPTSVWPSGAIAQTIPPFLIATSATAVTSGQLYVYGIMLQAGVTISNISFLIGSTAGATLTHGWFALLNSSFLQVAHTADQTSGGLTANAFTTKALTTAYTPTVSGQFWIAYAVVATQQPTMAAYGTGQGGTGYAAIPVGGASTTGLTGPGTDGTTTYEGPTSAGAIAYGYVS